MAFILKDETAGVNILYFDNSGNLGIMGSANAGQALSLAGQGIISSGATFANSIAQSGSRSALAGTIVVPINSSATVNYSVPQVPAVTADVVPSSVSTTQTVFTNPSTTADATYGYNIW